MTEFAAMADWETNALLDTANELQSGAQSATKHRLLRGKNLALLCDASEANDKSAALFHRSASALGAHVAQLRPSLSDTSTAVQVAHTSTILGRLYDGIECIGLSADLVRRIGTSAGVPVFEGMSSDSHPTSGLAQRLDPLGDAEDKRCVVMQAVLVSALA